MAPSNLEGGINYFIELSLRQQAKKEKGKGVVKNVVLIQAISATSLLPLKKPQ